MVYGAFLAAEDTTFARKASKKMPSVQNWKDHRGTADRGGYIFGHHWSILRLRSPFSKRWLCFPIIARLIPGKKNPSHFVSTPEGLRPTEFWDVTVSNVLAFVGCTDVTLNVAQIIELYAARFSLEIAIRDLKQHVDFCEYQSTIAIDRFVQLCCTAFCIWTLMMLPENAPTWLDDGKPTAINALSFARVRRGLRQFVVKRIF